MNIVSRHLDKRLIQIAQKCLID